MKGMVITEQGHIVNALPPVDIAGGALSDRFSMKHHGHATIIVQVGVSAAAFTKILVNECTAASGGSRTAIAFRYAAEETSNGDTLSSLADAAATGVTPAADDDIFYAIELDASELSDGSEWVEVELQNGSNSVIASVVAILSGSRYQNDQNDTVLA